MTLTIRKRFTKGTLSYWKHS